jgi:uncharacterized protein
MRMNYPMKYQESMKINKYLILSLFLIFQITSIFAQFEIPAKPSLQTSLYDYAKLLEESQAKQLEQKLINYFDSTGTQIVVAIVKTVDGGDVGLLASEWGHKWGVGGKEDNGVFILLAEQEREIYIAPGYGLEHLLTAGINGEIIRNDILPYFKQGDYYQGLNVGTDQLIKLFSGSYKKTTEKSSSGYIVLFVFLGFFAFIIFLAIRNKNNKGGGGNSGGGSNSGFDWLDAIILSQTISSGGSSSHGRGGGGFSGGGGFGGGFGGGGFSGGGAGGRW